MLKEERLDHILQTLQRADRITYEGMAAELKVSEDTIRRDIELLHKNGLLARVRGGAMLRSHHPLAFQDRTGYLAEGKNVIALKAQSLIRQNQTVFLDGGTTLCAVAAHFPADIQFRAVTNNQALVPILAQFKKIELVILGGYYNRVSETSVGAQTCREAAMYVADLYLMGTCAIDHTFGITASDHEDGAVKQAMLGASLKKVVLSNQEKIGITEHFKICDISDIDTLVTDLPSDDTVLDAFRDLEVL